ncbi:MAG: ARMT1-like domain-containing protein [Syntrophorhabdaceae bacterium]|nr:ARMT1-like domain-containing protein [Syntrophorhabdaceae bacterium]
MNIWPDCIPCILKMSLNIAREILGGEEETKAFFARIMTLEPIKENRWDITAPEIIRDIWRLMEDTTGIKDPLYEKKRIQNNIALNLYPYAKESVVKSSDTFKEALRWSIAGNFIDIMAGVNNIHMDDILSKVMDMTIDGQAIEEFMKRIKKVKKVVYLCDNCGEIVFDRLFAETLRDIFKVDVVFVVRSIPVLNDATLEDAFYTGLNNVGEVMENGLEEPLPGLFLSMASKNLKALVDDAGLVISKGGGNFDTLSDDDSLKGKATFLMQAKCQPYALLHGVKKGDLIINNF